MWIREAALDAFAALLPVECAGCGRPDRRLCDECRGALVPSVLRRDVDGVTVYSGAPYDGVVRDCLIALKVRSRVDVARALAPLAVAAVSAAVAEVDDKAVCLVVVPPTRSSLRERGFRPIEEVLRHARLPMHRALRIMGPALDQSGLGREQRAENLHGIMRARGSIEGRNVLVVDDILTSGATLREAARALSTAGAHVVGAATLAAARLRSQGW